MTKLSELYQSGDWKAEKHVPTIDAPDAVQKGETVTVMLSVGKEIIHPNTTEHHISWIELYFHPEGEKFPYQVGRCEFVAHGASTQGPNTSTVFTAPSAVIQFKTEKSGNLLASSYCNIHGLWQNAKPLAVK